MSAAKTQEPARFVAHHLAIGTTSTKRRRSVLTVLAVALGIIGTSVIDVGSVQAQVLNHSSDAGIATRFDSSLVPSRDQSWIEATYQLFLTRSATLSELEAGQIAINTRGRIAHTELLATSPEWAGVVVDDLFQSALDRHADTEGRNFWIKQLYGGARTRDISISIFGSTEAQTRSANNGAFVSDLYSRILGRSPESTGLHFWTTRLDNGSNAWEIVNGLWDSTEFRNTRVATTYAQVLGRGPDGSGQRYWAGRLLDIDEVRLAAFLAASDEFYDSVKPLDTLPDPELGPDDSVPRLVQDYHTLGLLLDLVRVAPERVSPYDRDDWEHWSDLDGDGCSTRCQVIKDEQLPSINNGSVGYLSVYDGVTFGPTESGMHLDHVVALAEAHRSGGHDWSPEKKEAFANDLGWDRSLILVSATSNLSKSSRDPDSWMPPAATTNPAVGCTYLRDWLGGKYRWDLTIDQAERSAIVTHGTQLGCFGT